MTLSNSVAQFVVKTLPYDRSNRYALAALKQSSAGDLLALYLNWRRRLIVARPREVVCSAEFNSNPLSTKWATHISQLKYDIQRGDTLLRYLSNDVEIGFEAPALSKKKNLKSNRYLDLLLIERGIHHLHVAAAGKDAARGNLLVFAIFRPDRAFLLDVGAHDEFNSDRLARIAVSNWPDDELYLELRGVRGDRAASLSDEVRRKLRSVGVSNPVQVGERAFISASGVMTSAGLCVFDTIFSDRIMFAVKWFEETTLKDRSHVDAFINMQGKSPPDEFEFEFAHFDNAFGFIERSSGALIGLVPTPAEWRMR